MKKTYLAFIGGSGLYDLPELEGKQHHDVETPFGKPSDGIVTGTLKGKPVAFLPRHGRLHSLLPHEINSRANIYALKKLGVTHILSISAVGSLAADLPPGIAVIPDQVLNFTHGRQESFFGEGMVGHVSFADPFCSQMMSYLEKALAAEKIAFQSQKVLVTIPGPRFNTRAESLACQKWGAHIVGMTAVPEAILAREAEIPYANLAFVTDYDSWRLDEKPVTVDEVLAVHKINQIFAKKAALHFHGLFPEATENPIFEAARHAIVTEKSHIPALTREKLNLFYGKYWS